MSAAVARAILAGIVVAATVLAGAWAFFVPMMQDPDESAHIDYAFSLLTARRVVLTTGDSISTDVHPYTRYLEAVSGFRGMRYSSYGRVPPGYGTQAFFAHVDAAAPRVTPKSGDTRPLPLYAHAYPFGFYALEAAVMSFAGFVLPGSLVSQFFAARLFCVTLLIPTLLCSYGIFRYLRLTRALALVITAGIAFFPLTSSTFSYVQPDNLVAALVAATLLVALHLRDEPSLGKAVAVGALLAALALTKYHDALVLLAAITFVAASEARVRAKLAYIIVPSFIAFAAGAAGMWLPPLKQRLLCAGFGLPIHAALKGGPLAFVPYVATSGANFFAATFAGGWPFVEYWDAVGWIPHRFVFVTEAITDDAVGLLSFVTLATLAVFLMRTGAVFRRLAALGHTRGAAAVVRLLSHDIVLNAYLAYLGFMLAANVYGANFLQHGRYWLPYIFGAVLCAVRYVPHFVAPRLERTLAAIVAVALATYSLIAVIPALDIVNRSYYVPRGSKPYVERFATFDRATIERFSEDRITRGQTIEMSGYAVDGPSEAVARGASLLIDGKRRLSLPYGTVRTDVICTFNDVSLARSGFRARFETSALAPGRHSIELQISEAEFSVPVSTANRLSFVIDASERQASRVHLTRPI